MNYASRLKRLEKLRKSLPNKEYIFFIGKSEDCQFRTYEEYQEEIKKPKYENADIIAVIEPDWSNKE